MPKNKDSKLFGMKRCGPFKIKLERRPPSDQAWVELITPVSSADDAVQSSASSTIVLPSSSPPASISTSFFAVRTEPQQTEPLLTSTPDTSFASTFYSPSVLPSPVLSPIYSMPAPFTSFERSLSCQAPQPQHHRDRQLHLLRLLPPHKRIAT